MNKDKIIPNDVYDFIDKSSKIIGEFRRELHAGGMEVYIKEKNIKSPIEQLFLIALHTILDIEFAEVNPSPIGSDSGIINLPGINIYPQYQLGKYFIDFVVSPQELGNKNTVAVELDGHDFHDKNKQQRAYEKSRDRYIVNQGYKLLHFTGSEVTQNPFKVAYEVYNSMGFYGDYEYFSGCYI